MGFFDHTKPVGSGIWESVGFWAKNLFFFATALVSSISLYDSSLISMPRAIDWVTAYTLFDTTLYKLNWDIRVHHAIVLTVSLYNTIYGQEWDPYYVNMMYKIFLYTEVSSVTLGIQTIFNRLLIEGKDPRTISKPIKITSTIIQLLFALSFYAVRIHYYTKHFIFNHDLIDYIGRFCWEQESYPMEAPITYGVVMIPMLSLFALNAYWFNIMVKTIVKATGLKALIGKISRAHYERILTYTLFSTSIAVSYLYCTQGPTFKVDYYYDMVGTFLLGIASAIYHNFYERYYRDDQMLIDFDFDQVVGQHKMVTFIDQMMIHLRMIMMPISNFGMFSIVPQISQIVHLFTFGLFSFKLFKIEEEQKYYEKKYPKDGKNSEDSEDESDSIYKRFLMDSVVIPEIYDSISFASGISFTLDNLFISFLNPLTVNTYYTQFNFVLFVLIALGFIIKPFYEANQVYIHLLLILQSFVLVYINFTDSSRDDYQETHILHSLDPFIENDTWM